MRCLYPKLGISRLMSEDDDSKVVEASTGQEASSGSIGKWKGDSSLRRILGASGACKDENGADESKVEDSQ